MATPRTHTSQWLSRRAIALTLLVMLGLALTASRFPSSSRSQEETPEDCVWTMVRAEQRGEWDVYRACFAGPSGERRLRQASSRTASLPHLGDATGPLQGISVVRRKVDGTRAELALERVYAGYNTRQEIRLRQVGRSWKITHLDTPRSYVPQIAYGTPVEGAGTAMAEESIHEP